MFTTLFYQGKLKATLKPTFCDSGKVLANHPLRMIDLLVLLE